jgi:soluble lytic murein transglycosylase-like protein
MSVLFYGTAQGHVSQEYIKAAIEEAAQEAGVSKDLLLAICTTESNLKADAFVYSDGGANNHAYGICQVLSETAKKYVGKDKKCERDFRDLVKNYKTCNLFGPKVNALAAAYYLKSQLVRYKGNTLKAVAAFNSGSVRKCSEMGWVTNKHGKRIQRCRPGGLLNSYYVNRVKSVLSKNSSKIVREFANIDHMFTINRG